VYTAFPVFSLVLDTDVDENLANLYPELYRELTTGRSLSYRTFFVWVLVSVYQGCVIQGLSQLLTEVSGAKMVAVSYTALVLNELLMVAIEITTWHWLMVVSIVGTLVMFIGSVPFLGEYYDLEYLTTLYVSPPSSAIKEHLLTWSVQGFLLACPGDSRHLAHPAVRGQVDPAGAEAAVV
jgi:phospholipid-translocating ATPase